MAHDTKEAVVVALNVVELQLQLGQRLFIMGTNHRRLGSLVRCVGACVFLGDPLPFGGQLGGLVLYVYVCVIVLWGVGKWRRLGGGGIR